MIFNNRLILLWVFSILTYGLAAQLDSLMVIDSLKPLKLDEVVVINAETMDHLQQAKPLNSVEKHLQIHEKVNFVRRGAYAWEPTVNSMTGERVVLTIDGMRIFGACTDRMDPITSYVDVSNLSEAHIGDVQQGAEFGSCVGGGIDLCIAKPTFGKASWKTRFEAGYESNNKHRIMGTEVTRTTDSYYFSGDVIYRKADNYRAGGGVEIPYSQFEKMNFSFNAGHKMSEEAVLSASFIYDEARNIGYPALPMDVSLARGLIGSVTLEKKHLGSLVNWQSKLYYNSITHVMDDSQRPDVPIRMDMPGWSDTYGFYSQAHLHKNKHHLMFKWDAFYNRSLAEMTMYPSDEDQLAMFMLTWPDVRTTNTGAFLKDEYRWENKSLSVALRAAAEHSYVASEMGLNSLQIFYPQMSASQLRFTKNISLSYAEQHHLISLVAGLAYGDRTPSVSEAYGFYLYNSNDNHDYIGNPHLRNEQSIETKAELKFEKNRLRAKLSASNHFMPDYIIGETDPGLSAMTIGAQGVRIYKNLDYANLVNVGLQAGYQLTDNLGLDGGVNYARGLDYRQRNLPFISPLTYHASVKYSKKSLSGGISLRGAITQNNFSAEFAEDATPAYALLDFNFGKNIRIGDKLLQVKLGMENVLDTYYHTYSDWNNIPRLGRNLFLNISYNIY